MKSAEKLPITEKNIKFGILNLVGPKVSQGIIKAVTVMIIPITHLLVQRP